jgi:hypothetical protein
MHSMVAAAAAGTDQPAATAAKIKTASHTKFRTRPPIAPIVEGNGFFARSPVPEPVPAASQRQPIPANASQLAGVCKFLRF